MATSSNRQTFIRFYTDYPNTYFDKGEEIIENSLSLEQTLIEGGLQFGVPCADKFECDLRNDFTVARKTTIWVYQIIDDDSEHPYGLFFGKVDSMKMDALGYTTHLIAYDRFYFRRNKSVRKWWKKYWKAGDNDYTVKGIRDALLTKYGFRFDDVTMMNDDRIIYEPVEFKQITFGELLTQMCAINACIPHIDSSGKVCFIQLSNVVDHQLTSNDMETENCEFEYYDTPEIDGVSVENTEMVISSDEDDDDDADNIFAFPYNIFFEGKKEKSMKNRAVELYEAINHITYRPCSVKMIQSDYDIQLGDRMRLTVSRNGQQVLYNAFVFKNDFSGPLLLDQTFSCDGESEYTVSTGSGLASKVNASTDIVVITVEITVECAEQDTVTVKDEDGVVLVEKILLPGESSTTFTLDIPFGGQLLTFESAGYLVSKDEFITGDTTVVLAPDVFAYYFIGAGSKFFYSNKPKQSWLETTPGVNGCTSAIYAFGAIMALVSTSVYISSDVGQSWSLSGSISSTTAVSLKYLDNKAIVLGIDAYYAKIYQAVNATTWNFNYAYLSFNARDIAFNGAATWVIGGQFSSGSSGCIAYTTSPIADEDWNEVTVDTRIMGVDWFGSFFIARAYSGKIFKSTDGASWTKISVSNATGNVISLAGGNDVFICITLYGNGCKVYRSTNQCVTWTEVVPSSSTSSRGYVVFGNGKFMIVRDDGSVQLSSDGQIWEDGASVSLPNNQIYGLSYVGE